MNSPPQTPNQDNGRQNVYWTKSLQIVLFILAIWFVLSLGCGVLFREKLDALLPPMGGAPFGFWMAQQGAIIGFLILLFLYMVLMNSLDGKSGFDQEDEE
ncbi:MAG: DUF4212 domain-containing protein [Mariniblastus sp.]